MHPLSEWDLNGANFLLSKGRETGAVIESRYGTLGPTLSGHNTQGRIWKHWAPEEDKS